LTSPAAPGCAHAGHPSAFVVRTETRVAVASTAEFERRRIQAAARIAGRVGFVGGTLLRSLSHPAKYVELSTYENLEVAWAVGQESAWTEHEGVGLGATVTRHEAYELVHELVTHSSSVVGCEVLTDEVVKHAELAPAFEATLRQLFELRRAHAPGFTFNRLLRSAGRLGSFLVVQGYADLAAAGDADTSADVQSFIHDHPAELYADAPASAEAYAVIARVPEPSITTEEAT
jgi:hypothetical protein